MAFHFLFLVGEALGYSKRQVGRKEENKSQPSPKPRIFLPAGWETPQAGEGAPVGAVGGEAGESVSYQGNSRPVKAPPGSQEPRDPGSFPSWHILSRGTLGKYWGKGASFKK